MDIGLGNIDWSKVDENSVGGASDAAREASPSLIGVQLESPQHSSFTETLGDGVIVEPVDAPEPDLVFAPGASAKPYPLHALGPLRDVVDLIARRTQAPVAIAAGSALGVAALAVQGHADVQTLAGQAPTSLFLLTVAKSGERKSACDKMLSASVGKHEREQDNAYRKAMTRYLAASEGHRQLENRVKNQIRAEEAGPDALANLPSAPRKPLLPDRVMTEPTFEGVTKLFAEGNPSQGLLSDEGGQFLGGHAMNTENRQKTLTAFSKLWDGSPIKRTRAGDGSTTLRGRRLSLHLMVQPEVAAGLLSDQLAIGQGFVPRMLSCQPVSNIGRRVVDVTGDGDEMSLDDQTVLLQYEHRLLDTLRTVMPTHDGAEGQQGQELCPRVLPLSGDARIALGLFAQQIERAQAPGGVLSDLTGTASKIAEQACRIAGVLTLFGDLQAREVSGRTMGDAIELAGWYLFEAMRLTGAAQVSREEQETEALRVWLLTRWPDLAEKNGLDPHHLIPRSVVRFGPSSMRSTAKAKGGLASLARLGWLVKLEPGAVVDGRTRTIAYRVAHTN